MSNGSVVADAGLRDVDLTIDGVSLRLPHSLSMVSAPRLAIATSATGRQSMTLPYDGVGLPLHADIFSFELEYAFDDNYATEIAFLETLRTQASSHDLCVWKKKLYAYTATAAQALIYAPRRDAFAENYAGKTGATYQAVVKRNGVALAVAYDGGAPASGNARIVTTSLVHPDSGVLVTQIDLHAADIALGDLLTVEYHPLFRVAVMDVVTAPFVLFGREDKTLQFVEVAS